MDEQEREIVYWLCKLLLLNLKKQGLLSIAEVRHIRKKLLQKYKPTIGSLDSDDNEKENYHN